ncbi:MAG: hypothetical protein AB7N24_19210 [Dehalococcoidia bacterium]
MHNPFTQSPDTSEYELAASSLFGTMAFEGLSAGSEQSIRSSMLAALASTSRSVATPRRFALAGSAFVAPLLVVGAASAATGTSPLEAPVTVLQVASSAVGVGGHSTDVRQDTLVRDSAAKDNSQPGSQPGNTANAPGLDGAPSGGEEGPSNVSAAVEASDTTEPTSDTSETPTPEEQLPPHENGKGCDDVLFANGEPPFASPGGPVGCEVGNSADHRKNGAKQDSSDTQEPAPSTQPTDEAAPAEDDSQGGTSHGLGKGHDEDPPGNGNGFGHDKHDHDPNPNGKGPGGPNAQETPAPESTPSVQPGSQAPEPNSSDSSAPGKSGSAPGKNKTK